MSVIGLDADHAVIYRVISGLDAEGNSSGGLSQVFEGTGFLGSPGGNDSIVAAQLSATVSAVLAVELSDPNAVQIDDEVECRGSRWTVVFISDVRSHYRLFLERR